MSDKEVYATYHQKLDAGILVPEGSKWDALRAAAEGALYQEHKRDMRFRSALARRLGAV